MQAVAPCRSRALARLTTGAAHPLRAAARRGAPTAARRPPASRQPARAFRWWPLKRPDWRARALAGEGLDTPPAGPSAGDALRAGRPLGLGFSAGGLLFPYYTGVAFALVDEGVLDPGATPLAGASAGSLIAACVGAGLGRDEVEAACLALAEDCRQLGTRGRLGHVLRDFLEAHLPPDAADRARGRVHVAVTAALPRPRPVLVSDFESREDLISALLTSCHIPFWMDGKWARDFRGETHLDGGITRFLPLPPDTHAVGVCCFPSRRTLLPAFGEGRLIAPDVFDEAWDVPLPTLLQWAFSPAGEGDLKALAAKGDADARAWAAASGAAGAAAELRAAKAVRAAAAPTAAVVRE